MAKWIEIGIALAGLLFTAYVLFTPNPVQQALLELIQALIDLVRSMAGRG